MSFDYDAFISYTHIDNVGLVEGSKGWITNLHRALEIRIAQLLGEKPEIWRDPKLAGNDVFERTLIDQLSRAAALITVVSPRYVRSEWTRRELIEFWKAAEAQGGVRLHDKARIFKVMKTPIPREMDLPELQPLLGYEFFKIDAVTGRVRELDEVFGPEAQRDFWMRLDDLAHDIADLLEMLRHEALSGQIVPDDTKGAVYLAETTSDLTDQRDAIRRDLQQHGYTVLPAKGLPMVATKMRTAMKLDLDRCRMSIHMIGKFFSPIPFEEGVNLVDLQNEMAIERGSKGGFTRLLWIPAGLVVEDERQAKLIERFRRDSRLQAGADLLETFLEELRTVVHTRLNQGIEGSGKAKDIPRENSESRLIYLIYDQRDAEIAAPYADALFDQGFEILHPSFEGGETEVRQCHEENLRICNGALIVYGSTNGGWVRRKLSEVQKSVGYGRTDPLPAVAILCAGAASSDKDRFRTHEGIVIHQGASFSADSLESFVEQLKS